MATVSFRERLAQNQPILGDGAMGTLLHQRSGLPTSACFDELNLSDPEIVRGVHRDYLAAGADIIETNTFSANRFKLAEHGLEHKLREINAAGIRLAQQAVAASGRENVYVAGSVGPLGVRLKPYGRINKEEAHDAFAEQVSALVEAGADVIIFETFPDHHELLIAVAAAKTVAQETPIIAQTTFAPDNMTLLGYPPARVANELYSLGVDVLGVNCSGGPSQLAALLQAMHTAVPQARLSAMPNAGFPESVGGRVMYPATADYFGEYALTFKAIGAAVIGGCCGSTPAHIRAMRRALDDPSRALPEIHVEEFSGEEKDNAPLRPPTALMERLGTGQFTVTVEIAPPRSFSLDKLLRSARLLRDAGANMLNIADTPAARMRMSPWAVCHVMQTQLGMETVLHFPTRGRNLLRIQGDLLAAHALDLRNLFVTMGDPTKIGDYPDAMDNYDIVPSKLIELIKQKMNNGEDMAGNSIGKPTNFTVGCALNMGADDLDHEIKVLGNKLAAGSDFALGQAVFEPHKIDAFHNRYQELHGEALKLPVLLSIMPLFSLKQAQFLHNEVPGISIPEHLFKRMEDAGEAAAAEGVKIAQELVLATRDKVQGFYVIPAFGRYDLAAEVLSVLTVPA